MADHQKNVLTDHAYDGIQEYDNPMPGWWVWGFILTIIFAFPYWAWFHLSEDRGIYAQLDEDMARAEALAPKLEETKEALLSYLDDDEIVARGEKVFGGVCSACHTPDGGGLNGLGPNLTDDRWKLISSIEQIVPLVRDGYKPESGAEMPAHSMTHSQQEIVSVSVYVATLLGTEPSNPKEPEGDIVLSSWQ